MALLRERSGGRKRNEFYLLNFRNKAGSVSAETCTCAHTKQLCILCVSTVFTVIGTYWLASLCRQWFPWLQTSQLACSSFKVCKQLLSGRDVPLNDLRWGTTICGIFHRKVDYSLFLIHTVNRVWAKHQRQMNVHSNHGWVDKTWCIFGGIILGKWKTFDTWLSWNMQTICPDRDDSFSLSTYDGKKFHQLIFLSPKTTTTTKTKRSRKIQPETTTGPNDPVDNYWSGLLYFHTNISFTSKGELTHRWVPYCTGM